MPNFFRSLFGKSHSSLSERQPAKPAEQQAPPRQGTPIYTEGDVIGRKYTVCRLLGRGGFGMVYLTKDPTGKLFALKTFHDELLANNAAREAFRKEALLWVRLEVHPFILAARDVKIVSGRLFVAMDYVPPDAEGRVHLGDYLQSGQPISQGQASEWAIQFCLGMEHANAHGIRCHRDIKPENILISKNTIKIADFGLAAAEAIWEQNPLLGDDDIREASRHLQFSILRTEGGMRCGTPGYMAPEIYRGDTADVRCDIYSFGLVLWQMVTGSNFPPHIGVFRDDMDKFLNEIYRRQLTQPTQSAGSPFDQIICRCVHPDPQERYSDFRELRGDLVRLQRNISGKEYTPPSYFDDTALSLIRKAGSLMTLQSYEESLRSVDKALADDPDIQNIAGLWAVKGHLLRQIGRLDEAMACCEKALHIDRSSSVAWCNKANVYQDMGKHDEALAAYDELLSIRPMDDAGWYFKARALKKLKRHTEAMACYDKTLSINPKYPNAFNGKGLSCLELGRHEEAIFCFENEIRNNPRSDSAWSHKGNVLNILKCYEESIICFDQALSIDPLNAFAWHNKGIALHCQNHYEDAIICYGKVIDITPKDSIVWYNKALSEDALGEIASAISDFTMFLELTPPQKVEMITYATNRIRALHGKLRR